MEVFQCVNYNVLLAQIGNDMQVLSPPPHFTFQVWFQSFHKNDEKHQFYVSLFRQKIPNWTKTKMYQNRLNYHQQIRESLTNPLPICTQNF